MKGDPVFECEFPPRKEPKQDRREGETAPFRSVTVFRVAGGQYWFAREVEYGVGGAARTRLSSQTYRTKAEAFGDLARRYDKGMKWERWRAVVPRMHVAEPQEPRTGGKRSPCPLCSTRCDDCLWDTFTETSGGSPATDDSEGT